MFIASLGADSKFVSVTFANSLHDVKAKPQLEVKCAVANRFPNLLALNKEALENFK
jgi:hypothetical protein